MGQRMPAKEIDYGDDCLASFPAGKTPLYVYVRFVLLEKCVVGDPNQCHQPPNGRVFKFTQDSVTPCLWTYSQSGWAGDFRISGAAPLGERLDFWDDDGFQYFSWNGAANQDEGTVFANQLPPCGGMDCATGGIAVVTWTPQATALLESLNISKGLTLFKELFPLPSGNLVYKFCDVRFGINVKILFNP